MITRRENSRKSRIEFYRNNWIIIKAKLENIIPSIKPLLEKIKQTNFRISPEIELQAYKEAKEI